MSLRKSVVGLIFYAALVGIGIAKDQDQTSEGKQVCFSVPSSCTGDCGSAEKLNETIQGLIETVGQLSAKLESFSYYLYPSYFVDTCSVGLKDGRISDSEFSASSIWDARHAASNARLDYQTFSGSWSSRENAVGQWVQVDLGTPTYVTGVITQGRFSSQFAQWVTSYKIQHSNDGSSFRTVKDDNGVDIVFQGNIDKNTYVMNRFPEPITARYFRLVAQAWFGHVSVRMEFITC